MRVSRTKHIFLISLKHTFIRQTLKELCRCMIGLTSSYTCKRYLRWINNSGTRSLRRMPCFTGSKYSCLSPQLISAANQRNGEQAAQRHLTVKTIRQMSLTSGIENPSWCRAEQILWDWTKIRVVLLQSSQLPYYYRDKNHDVLFLFEDYNFYDGMEAATFEAAVDHVMKSCFDYSRTVSLVVQHQYTDWKEPDNPVEKRAQYINVITNHLSVCYDSHKLRANNFK